MSGGEKKKKSTRSQGWEEAGGEFYQESYPGEGDMEAIWKDPKRLQTLLPSKQTRAVAATIRLRTNDTRTNKSSKSTVRRHTNHSRRDSTVHRRTSTIGGEVQVSMLPDLSEMRSNEETAWQEIMKIKELPIPMSQKREEKSKIMTQQHLRLQGFDQFRWKRQKAWHSFTARLGENLQKLELWRHDLKKIEGHFGTGVVAFFRFIKWLFFLNLFTLFIVLMFVVMPVFFQQEEVNCNDMDCFSKYYCAAKNGTLLSLLQGSGFLEVSPLFYGVYPNSTLNFTIGAYTLYYNLPLSYILTTLTYFLVSLIAIVRTGAKGFKERLTQGEGVFYQYSNLVFGGWDYCIQNEKSARGKSKAIWGELKSLLEVERLEEERMGRTKQEKWRLLFLRFLTNSLVFAILIVSGTLIYFTFNFSSQQLTVVSKVEDYETKLMTLLYEFLPSMCIVALNIVVPFMFQFLLTYEHYSPLMQIRISLIRTVFLRLASLIVFYVSMYKKTSCNSSEAENGCGCTSRPRCWETFIGQQIFKLLLTDFAIQFSITFVVNFLRSLLARHCSNKFIKLIGEQHFDLSKHALDVVYTQTLCWIGVFFAPLLCLLSSLIFCLLFYIKKFACLVNCKPGNTILYRASKSTSMFMAVLLVSYPVALAPLMLVWSEMTPSRSCGPFRQLSTIWTLIEDTFLSLPLFIQTISNFLITPAFTIPLFIVLVLFLYYYSAVTSANRHMVTVLKNQLVLEGHDKKFLIDRLLMFIKQENDKRSRMRGAMDSDTITNASSIQS